MINMKYLKKYNENTFDQNHAVVEITRIFTEKIFSEMLADEIKEWVDKEGDYAELSNGEAEDVIIHQLISWYKKEFSKQLDEEQKAHLEAALKEKYKLSKPTL